VRERVKMGKKGEREREKKKKGSERKRELKWERRKE